MAKFTQRPLCAHLVCRYTKGPRRLLAPTMGEAWDDLDTFRRLRAECADGIKEITTACARDHPQHKHVIECRECYEKVIDRMRSRYSDAKATEKWFSVTVEPTRKELDELFTAAKEYKVGLAEIDRRAEEERKRSYAHQVKASPSIRKSLEELVDGKELFASIGVKDATFDEVVAEVRKALRGPGVVKAEAGAEDAEKALQRLMEAKTPEERLQAYKQTFFSEKPDEAVAGKTQMYLDRLEEGATMDDIVNKIAVDRRSSIGAMDRKEMHKKRIEELRRARAAHELEKQRKASKDSVQNRQPTDAAYNAAPCNACGRQIDTLDYTACPICIALVEAGIRRKATTFCAKPKCFNGGYGYVGSRFDSNDGHRSWSANLV